MKQKFTRIKGAYSEVRYLPRIGKIRLGIKVRSPKGAEYPRETKHFVVPPEVAAIYGTEPTELDVMFPMDDPEVVFPQKLAWYGKGTGLRCHGNMEEALRRGDDGEWAACACPCDQLKTDQTPKGQCTKVSSLMVLLPHVSMGGCYQINTGSRISTTDINSSMDYILAMVGRIALIPLKLRRVPREIVHQGQSTTHYTLSLVLDGNIEAIRQLRNDSNIPSQYLIESPVDENPECDPADEAHKVDAPMYPEPRPPLTPETIAERAKGRGEPVQQEMPPLTETTTRPPLLPPPPTDNSSQAPPETGVQDEPTPWVDPPETGLQDEPTPGSIESQVVDFRALDDATMQATEIMVLVARKLPENNREGLSLKKAKGWSAPYRIQYFKGLLSRPDIQQQKGDTA